MSPQTHVFLIVVALAAIVWLVAKGLGFLFRSYMAAEDAANAKRRRKAPRSYLAL